MATRRLASLEGPLGLTTDRVVTRFVGEVIHLRAASLARRGGLIRTRNISLRRSTKLRASGWTSAPAAARRVHLEVGQNREAVLAEAVTERDLTAKRNAELAGAERRPQPRLGLRGSGAVLRCVELELRRLGMNE
jgi:hypothetical protein